VKNILRASAVFIFLTYASSAEEFSPKQVFDNGFASALDVIEYSNAIREKGEFSTEGKHCMKLNLTSSHRGEVYKIFKLFSLSLKLGMDPIFLIKRDDVSEKIFCLGIVDDYQKGIQEISEVRKRYHKIDSYNPRVISLTEGEYIPSFPFLGENNFASIPAPTKRHIKRDVVRTASIPSLPDEVAQSSLSPRVYVLKNSKKTNKE